MDVLGLVLVLIFYGAILLAGVWVAQRHGLLHPKKAEDLMLAGRNFGLTVGIFTLVMKHCAMLLLKMGPFPASFLLFFVFSFIFVFFI